MLNYDDMLSISDVVSFNGWVQLAPLRYGVENLYRKGDPFAQTEWDRYSKRPRNRDDDNHRWKMHDDPWEDAALGNDQGGAVQVKLRFAQLTLHLVSTLER